MEFPARADAIGNSGCILLLLYLSIPSILHLSSSPAMLHRRQAGSTSSAPPPASNAPPRDTNQAFKPLRRESGSLYSPPVIVGSPSKPRYPIPSASPALNNYASQASSSYFPAPAGPSNAGHGAGYGFQPSYNGGNTFDLTEKLGSFPGTTDEWMAAVRHGIDTLRRGFGDAARLAKSWSMAWR